METRGKITVVVGGQLGSEAKGACCAALARRDAAYGRHHVAVRVGGSQAGHTVYDDSGREIKLRHVPVAAAVNREAMLVIAAGSEIDIEVLIDEIMLLESMYHFIGGRLFVHPSATVITQAHKDTEAALDLTGKIGSTAKGVGAARADRIMRTAPLFKDEVGKHPYLTNKVQLMEDAFLPNQLASGAHVLIEGVQGFGLGLHTENYPYTTSADARAIDFLAMAGLSPWAPYVEGVEVLIVFRTRPIRVAGNSGPMKSESSWAELGLPEEKTTVTLKTRRVASEFDWEMAQAAVKANGGHVRSTKVTAYLSMLDQLEPETKGLGPAMVHSLDGPAQEFIEQVSTRLCPVSMISTGPQSIFMIGTGR